MSHFCTCTCTRHSAGRLVAFVQNLSKDPWTDCGQTGQEFVEAVGGGGKVGEK